MNQSSGESKRHSAFLLLCAAGGFAIFSSTMSKTPVLPLFADSLGASPKTVGLIAAAATMVGILISAPAGLLSDYVGRKRIILAAGFVFASAPFLYYAVETSGQLAALRLYHGFATAIFGPVALAYVADMFSSQRAERMGWFSSATLIGRFLAPLLGGLLIVRYDFRTVYLFCGVFGAVAFILLFSLSRNENEPISEPGEKPDLRKLPKELKILLSNVPLVATSFCDAALYFAFGAVETFFPLYAVKNGMNAGQVGVLFSAQVLTIAFSKPLMGRLSDRYGRKGSIVFGLVLGSVAVACIALTRQFIAIALAFMAFGLAMSIVTASTAALAADLSRKGAHGSSMGLLSSIMDVGHASGPVVTGIIIAGWSYGISFGVASAVMLAAIVPFSFLVRKESADKPQNL